jgi:mannosyltransferase
VVLAAGVLALIATTVNALGSWIPSLWGDEAATQLSATRPLSSLMAMLGNIDIVHAVNYVTMHFWILMAGSSPFALRFPSAVAIGLCAGAIVWIGARLRSLPFGILAGALTAALPRLTHAAVEARAYAFDALLAAVLMAIIVEVLRRRRPSAWWWVAYGAVLAVATITFLYVGLLVVAIGVVLWWRGVDRRAWAGWALAWAGWALASAAGLLLAAPVAWIALHQRGQIAFLATAGHTNPHAILVEMWFVIDAYAWIAWALIAIAVVGWVRSRPRRGSPIDPVSIALPWAVIPLALVLASDAVHHDYTPRYLTFAGPAVALLLASGIAELARLRVGRVPVAALCVSVLVLCVTVPVWMGQRGPWSKRGSDWNDVAAVVGAQARPGDAIVFDESVDPSWRPRLALDTDPAAFAQLLDVQLVTPYAQSPTWHAQARSTAEAIAAGALEGVSRVWVVEAVVDGVVSTEETSDLRAAGYEIVEHQRINVSDVSLWIRSG